jgi:hypothetical protein
MIKDKVMKANAPESKFVYPDKLFARTNNNITIDISYAPQTLEAVEYTRTDAFIEKACDFLRYYRQDTLDGTGYVAGVVNDKTIEAFKCYMKGE